MLRRLVSVVAAGLVGVGVAMVALPAVESSAGTSACGLPTAKCVGIVSPFPNQSLVAGLPNQSITYTLQVDPSAPGSGLGSGSIQPTAGSGITFATVTSSVSGASCSISAAGAAICLNLGQRAGHTFTITVGVNVACDAESDTFSTLWSGASDFRNDPNGRGDQYLLDTASTQYLVEVVTGDSCGIAFTSEPATTTAGTGIPSLVDTSPTANPVQVRVLDGNGNPAPGVPVTISLAAGGPAGAVLSGATTETTNASGVASFPSGSSPPLSINEVGTYQLVASTPGYPTATSGTSPSDPGVGGFDVVDALVSCPTAEACSTSGSSGETTYTVNYTNNSGQPEILTSGLGDSTYDCGSYTPTSDSLTTAVYFTSTGLQDPSAVTTNDVEVNGVTWHTSDRTCFQSTTPIPESSAAPGYNCDPNAAGPCQGSADGQPVYSAILNTCSSQPSGTAPVGSGAHDVAVVAPDHSVYVSNAFDQTVSVINTATNGVIATIPVTGGNPQGLAYDAANDDVYVAVEGSSSVQVIDADPFDVTYDTVVATIPVGGFDPEEVGVDATTDTVYVSVEDTDIVDVISDVTNTVTNSVPVGTTPFGVAVDASTDLVYVANSQSADVSVIDGGTDTVSATIPLAASSVPWGIDVNPTTDTVYASLQGLDSVAVINGSSNTVTTTVPVAGTPYGVAVDSATDNVYVALNSANELAVIDGVTNALAGTIATGGFPWGVGVNPTTAMAYVANAGDSTVSALQLVGAPCQNFNRQITGDDIGAHFDWQSVGDPTGRDV